MVEQRLNYSPDSYQDDFEELKKTTQGRLC